MSIFDKVKKGMLDSTKTIKELSSEMTEMTRLKVALAKEKAQLDELYYDLGKILYSAHEHHVDTKELPEVVLTALNALNKTHFKITEYENRIEFLKGILKCNYCGHEVEENSNFCSNCGSKLTFILPESPKKEALDIENDEVELDEEAESLDTTSIDDQEKDNDKEPEQ